MIPLVLFLLGCTTVYVGTVQVAFSALMRLSLRLNAERAPIKLPPLSPARLIGICGGSSGQRAITRRKSAGGASRLPSAANARSVTKECAAFSVLPIWVGPWQTQ